MRSLDADPPQPGSPWGLHGNEPYASFSNSSDVGAPQVSTTC